MPLHFISTFIQIKSSDKSLNLSKTKLIQRLYIRTAHQFKRKSKHKILYIHYFLIKKTSKNHVNPAFWGNFTDIRRRYACKV